MQKRVQVVQRDGPIFLPEKYAAVRFLHLKTIAAQCGGPKAGGRADLKRYHGSSEAAEFTPVRFVIEKSELRAVQIAAYCVGSTVETLKKISLGEP